MTYTDQLGHTIQLAATPRRIISLVPSQTELLFDLGLENEVVGVTKFCIHPKEKCKLKTQIGGTKNLNLETIAALKPDLIIGNKEENERSQIEHLQELYPVWMSDIANLKGALDMIKSVGEITATIEKANALAQNIKAAFQSAIPNPNSAIAVAYLIWYRPWMAVGSGTFINSVLEEAGFTNVLVSKTRYPEITLEELADAKPEVVLLSSEPYPFRQKHFEEIKQLCPSAVVKLVDGELFSWYGSRLLLAAPYFANLHRELNNPLKS